jgi:hypothetical protein
VKRRKSIFHKDMRSSHNIWVVAYMCLLCCFLLDRSAVIIFKLFSRFLLS